LASPQFFQRDYLWSGDATRLQVELVVDNLASAGIANGDTQITNEHYRATLASMVRVSARQWAPMDDFAAIHFHMTAQALSLTEIVRRHLGTTGTTQAT
jgi:hypothetical protein